MTSQQRQVHGDGHVGPGRVPEHVGVDVRAVRRGRVRGGQHGPDAVRRGQRRAGHDAPAPGRGGPARIARTVRGQQGGRAGRVQRVHRGRRAQAARAHGTGPAVAVGHRGRGRRARPAGRRRAARSDGVAGGHGRRGSPAMTDRRAESSCRHQWTVGRMLVKNRKEENPRSICERPSRISIIL